MKLLLSSDIIGRIGQLYDDMEKAYDVVADQLKLSCSGCPDNCCDSFFLHHTYIEWGYLWLGMKKLSEDKQQEILNRAQHYNIEAEALLNQGERPRLMCPLNEEGRCVLYRYRLMVCRTHGVPATMTRPDGKRISFPGCFVCQDIVAKSDVSDDQIPTMERTNLFRRMVGIEQDLLEGKRHLAPRVKKTIAGMLVAGPPEIPHCSDGS